MIGVDTNILVRLFADDDPPQRRAAATLIDGLPPGEKALVNTIVLVELLWTLGRRYRFERDELAAVVRKLSEHPGIELPDRDVAREAAHRAREEGGQIVDHMIALLNRASGCGTTYTFDEEAAISRDFTLVST
jgi:predicted nucleic-acid-binding protein